MPRADAPWILFGPSWRRETVDVVSGVPEKRTAFKDELEPLPVMLAVLPCKKPEAERLVPEAFVNVRIEVETFATPRFVPEAPVNCSCGKSP